MTYQSFLEHVHTSISDCLGPSYSVTIRDIVKNNDTHLDGLTIQSPQCNLSPTIYLNNYFKQYEEGTSMSEICHNILDLYQTNRPSESIDVAFFTDYERVKNRIVYKLINYDRNAALLADVPCYRILDLALVFNCLVHTQPDGNATILIHNHHMDMWGITADDLYALAAENTPKILNYDLRNMTEVMREMLRCESDPYGDDTVDTDMDFSELCSMYVLSNRQKLNGASCILYDGLLKRFADKLGCDLYILPSSIHETIIIPATGSHSHPELDEMVRDVNETQVSREDILSDHAYYFSREEARLTM
jgi:hypothetical protein